MTNRTSYAMLAAAVAGAMLLTACDRNAPLTFSTGLEARSETGQPLAGVTVTWAGGTPQTGSNGRLAFDRLEHPILVVLSRTGYLDEPVVLGWDDQGRTVPVTMLDAKGGAQAVVHSVGDVMIGRRYEGSEEEGGDGKSGLIVPGDGGVSARALVTDIAPLFRAADLRMLNLECIVAPPNVLEPYPEKLWITRMHPDALAALDSLGANATVLANNHAYDFLDPGVEWTLASLEDWQLPALGSGLSAEEAERPLIYDIGGQRFGVLAFATVNGDYINDRMARDGDEIPIGLSPAKAWQYEYRTWGWEGEGVAIPTAERRCGSAWLAIEDAEEDLSEAGRAALWASARSVYPELLDYVARRGHGGAAAWDWSSTPGLVEALRPEVDVLIVNLHSGFQYYEAPSENLQLAARRCIDAGADLVVAHHPHILQGFEYYRGKLVAWSMGNFIFDQDFLVTFPSAILRTAWQGGAMTQARVIPAHLDAYRPMPAADAASRYILESLWERSVNGAYGVRHSSGAVRVVLPETHPENVAIPRFRPERGTAVIDPGLPAPRQHTVSVPAQAIADLRGIEGLVWAPVSETPPQHMAIGQSLFPWGNFEDVDTDAIAVETAHWAIDSEDERVVQTNPFEGRQCLELFRSTKSLSRVLSRPVARIPLQDHRFYYDVETPADGPPTYSVRVAVRCDGERGLGKLRLVMYRFDDLDPTAAPESGLIREVEFLLDVPTDNQWYELWADLEPEHLAPDFRGRPVAAILVYLLVEPATWVSTTMGFDDVDFVCWRDADQQPEVWGAYKWLRSYREQAASVQLRTLPW